LTAAIFILKLFLFILAFDRWENFGFLIWPNFGDFYSNLDLMFEEKI
jgi:hypothetical protein